MTTEWVIPTIVAANSVLLALIARLRWRCYPDPETGKCTMLSGCSEIPLTQDSHEMIEAKEYLVGENSRVLLVSAKT